jgi:hypothetical protein
MSVIAMFRQQPFPHTTNSPAVIDLHSLLSKLGFEPRRWNSATVCVEEDVNRREDYHRRDTSI